MFTFAVLAVMAFALSPIYACGNNQKTSTAKTDMHKTDAKMVSSTDKASCGASKATAQLTSEKGGCSAACIAAHQMSAEQCAKMCPYSTEVRVVSVQSMTCGHCEQKVEAALAKAPGVLKVINVSYKDGIALVAVDKTKANDKTMAQMVTDSGFKAEVQPAVATTTSNEQTKTSTKKSM